ncbi:cyclin-D3-2-like [Malus sylvestris]|uniref:cyclin-D3-2-like n=1 Tax=Malus sylvestris TaxID=3752 RepID=UPI0021AC7ADE|nr:cyclin-D3-2-like [Malus sylvestris]
MALQEEPQELQNPPVAFDLLLFCEEGFEEDLRDNGSDQESENCDGFSKKQSSFPLVVMESDIFWENDELSSLISKEEQTHVCFSGEISDGSLMAARKEAVEWILSVRAHYGFSSLTTVLAVNYFDRFIASRPFQRDKLWMSQLAAVACVSLAAKVEETHVPLLLDLQVEESKYVFEAKTIQRMELLVLSTLGWRMNPVTPNSYFDHIIRRFGLKIHLHWEFLWRCERLLLSVIADSRFTCYLPSVLATATMLYVIVEIEAFNPVEYQNQLMNLLKVSKDRVNECSKLILELSGSVENQSHKRKHLSVPSSPNGVINASFSCDMSNGSWAVASLDSSSPDPQFKRSRLQNQQMRLPSLNRVSVDVLSSSR